MPRGINSMYLEIFNEVNFIVGVKGQRNNMSSSLLFSTNNYPNFFSAGSATLP